MQKPTIKPNNPNFSSGPCSKRPGFTLAALDDALLGRSHRSKPGKAKLKEVIDRSSAILGLPDGYRLGIVPASDTGAVEMAMWSLLGPRGVDVLVWESFSGGWATDAQKQLQLDNLRVMKAEYGQLPPLNEVNWNNDVVFVWNGTTSGVRLENADWIPDDRAGLSICDATSAAFAMELPWNKLDVVTWSWQKVMGGEAAHGMLVLSPRAVERLESFTPDRPLPKIFRMKKGDKINEGIWEGSTINTPSMLAVEDALDGLRWAESLGGLSALVARSQSNLSALSAWADQCDWCEFLAKDTANRSSTSMCLKFTAVGEDKVGAVKKRMLDLLDQEGVAFDIGSYRDAPAGLRVWGGGTIEASDIEALTPWLDWAYATATSELA